MMSGGPASVVAFPESWRRRAAELERYAPPVAAALRDVADELEEALRLAGDEPLSLAQAAQESGYSVDRLRHMVAEKHLPNAGRKGAPRIRRKDLPRRVKSAAAAGYDADADARSIMALRR